jgi:hypothetical protein
LIEDNKLLIANGRTVAVTIHRLRQLDADAEDFVIGIQVIENGERDFENTVQTRYKHMRKAYDALRLEKPSECEYIVSAANGNINLSFGKHKQICLTQKEIYKVLVQSKKRVRESSS